jgi:hypothetical protein
MPSHEGGNRGRSAVSPATHTVGGPGTARPQPSHHPHTRVVRDTRRPPRCRPGPLWSWGRVPARPHPRSPALNSVIEGSGIFPGDGVCVYGLHFSLSSVFLFLLPFFCLPGELRAFALLGAPLLPLPSGAPLLPRHPGATGGRRFPPSLFGRGMMECSVHHPSRGGSRRTKGGPGPLPPHPGGHDAAVPRRLSSAAPPPPLAPPGSCPGDWETVTADWRPGLP